MSTFPFALPPGSTPRARRRWHWLLVAAPAALAMLAAPAPAHAGADGGASLVSGEAGGPTADETPLGSPYAAFALNANDAATTKLSPTQTRSIVNGMRTELSWQARTDDWLATTSVPEPQTYALWLAGLAVIGFVAHRRAGR
ncbi:MAG TPA: PEP-CTERM sorting domain-containing protein [Ideonella sp.]|nr:PEP-CTERM sorting domain-containing protein [Ideonella sp.]HJV68460.1 PEP-CTERM sorting domain-containing protein [Ideonella sp.]